MSTPSRNAPQGYGTVYSGTSGHSVVATGAVTGEVCAGWVKHATITSNGYGWLLKKGVVDAKNARASTAPVINQPAYLGSDGGFVTDTPVVTSAIDHGHVVGKILSAGASGGTGASLSLLYVAVV
jgi:2-keto-3-deoxy-6-phosphogluconate aldolase